MDLIAVIAIKLGFHYGIGRNNCGLVLKRREGRAKEAKKVCVATDSEKLRFLDLCKR